MTDSMETVATAAPRVYLAGSWKRPPLELCATLEEAGVHVVCKWWTDDADAAAHASWHAQLALWEQYDIFVLPIDQGDRDDHLPLAGSHIGAGIAFAHNRGVVVIGNTGPYTALLEPFCVPNVEIFLEALPKLMTVPRPADT